jgi:hypothetical protein
MKLAVSVTVDGQVLVLDLNKAESELGALQRAVGGWIQAVDLKNGMSMYLNEEGKVYGLEPNPVATKYFEDTYGVGSDVVVGDVVFTGLPDANGDTTSITSTQLQDIIDRAGARA